MQNRNELAVLMKMIYRRTLSDLKVAYIAKIVKLNEPFASVQPLALINGQKQPMVEHVRFLICPLLTSFHGPQKGYLNYHKGDNVLVVVMDHNNEYFRNGGKFKVASHRAHDIDFSMIVGKIASGSDFY